MKSKLRASQGMVDYFKKEQETILEDKIIIPKQEPKQELPKTEIDWSRFPKSTQKQVAEKYFRGLGEKDN